MNLSERKQKIREISEFFLLMDVLCIRPEIRRLFKVFLTCIYFSFLFCFKGKMNDFLN
jgi:hypothetical protein